MYGGGEDKREVMRKMEIVKMTVNSNRGINGDDGTNCRYT
jgi:hypothetical protein